MNKDKLQKDTYQREFPEGAERIVPTEEEVRRLREELFQKEAELRRIQEERRELEKRIVPERKEEIERKKEELKEITEKPKKRPVKITPPVQITDEELASDLRHVMALPKPRQVKVLIYLSFKKGLQHAVNIAKQLKDPYILDEFHDTLVDELYNLLVKRHKLKP